MSRKIRDSAKGQECQVRIPGACNFNSETVVLAHVSGGGVGAKVPDIHGAYCCSDCHDVVDGRVKSEYAATLVQLWFLHGVLRTQLMLVDQGLLEFKGK